jgi:hypothetical protein
VSAGPTDPTAAEAGGAGREPTEEEVRAYLGELRAAPVDQVVAEVASALLNAAQVKLGRRDGRLLIDLAGDLAERVRGVLPAELTGQVDQALTQLRMAQVEAEKELASAASQGHEEPSDLPASAGDDRAAGEPPAGTPSTPPSTPPTGGAASRLWVPGR